MAREGKVFLGGAARRLLFSGNRAKVILTTVAVVTSLGLFTGYTYWPRSPVELVKGDNMSSSGLYASWKSGEVVVLVRHGERCDRSSNECLGPQDGITRIGSSVSTQVGQAFNELGLAQTDVISSPATRTVQTAQSMFGHPIATENWLYECETTTLDEAMAHKGSNRNLILVTHSGCISQWEKQQGYPHAEASEYDSALFISLDTRGKPVIRGVLNPDDWRKLKSKKSD